MAGVTFWGVCAICAASSMVQFKKLSKPLLGCQKQWAAWSGDLPMLELLFEHSTNINRRDSYAIGGWTPFLGAIHKVLCRAAYQRLCQWTY